jgi:hypothetical protein
MMAAMLPRVASHASCIERPRTRSTFKQSSKLIAPAAVSAVNSPSDKPAAASGFTVGAEKEARLRVLGLGQIGFGAVEANVRKVVAERGVGAVEPLARGGKFFDQFPPHADSLGPLPCE